MGSQATLHSSDVNTNGTLHAPASISQSQSPSRSIELESLLSPVLHRLVQFVKSSDEELKAHIVNNVSHKSELVDYHPPEELKGILSSTLQLPEKPSGKDGLLKSLEDILKYSVNTSAPGFLDKLYSAPVAPGVAADLILSVLNTNLHVYQVSPVLTLIEKHVAKSLASLFGLNGPRSGGISVQGGSASNTTSIVIARNTLYPKTKVHGNAVNGLDLVLFTGAHGHYSIEKAAQTCGFGSSAVIPVPVDKLTGQMLPTELERLIISAKSAGKTPFYVNATAGSTVLGSFDPFAEIAEVAKRHGLWFHIDGAWGGSFVFSERLRAVSLKGAERADSIAINPHKMMGVPVTCSFLLGRDLKTFLEANTLRAGYLFHDGEDDEVNGVNGVNEDIEEAAWKEPYDLADMTLQCGRRGDSLKLFLAWQYYGTRGYSQKVENAHGVASHMVSLISEDKDFRLVSTNPPPCLQVCFYYAPNGASTFGTGEGQIIPPGIQSIEEKDREAYIGKFNSKITERITRELVARGFMIDFAPALEGREAEGKFFRAVVNIQTPRETVERLVNEIRSLGSGVVEGIRRKYAA
ncbi:hypothetical protein ABW19_dt0205287 [Dactylella cylindrospora]|nr:hypothetical protein ABW19_dt0205287 [Dactylella cylindrospora]